MAAFSLTQISQLAATERVRRLDNNLQCVDLSDLQGPLPLDVVSTKRILTQTEAWEHSSYKNPQWPAGGHQSLGYPTAARTARRFSRSIVQRSRSD